MSTVDQAAGAASVPNSGFGTKGYRSFVRGSLLLGYVFNFIDRSIITILTEPIKASFGVEDW
ncbi:MAG: MFS transporter, partial [Henriciella sp.]|nr:MFS transporter [Henriciella sp.]